AAGQGNARGATGDVGKLGPVFTPMDLERRQAAGRKVAEARGVVLVIAGADVVSAKGVDVTDDVVAGVPPRGPVTQEGRQLVTHGRAGNESPRRRPWRMRVRSRPVPPENSPRPRRMTPALALVAANLTNVPAQLGDEVAAFARAALHH